MATELFKAGGETGDALCEALEAGKVLFFERCPLELPTEAELALMRVELPRHLAKKNVSYYPSAGALTGLGAAGELAAQVRSILKAHAERVQAYFATALPAYAKGWTFGTASFRPMQEKGRHLSAHASNELVHVDAGAYGATHGARILRFFVNVNPNEDRVWASRGTFGELFEPHARQAGLAASALEESLADRARSGLLSALSSAGLRRAHVLDSSPYDRWMRRFHNYMKDDPRFRDGKDGYQELRFPPFSAWAVFTDTVSHACLSGQHAFVDTFLVPLECCRRRELSPFETIRRGAQAGAQASAASTNG